MLVIVVTSKLDRSIVCCRYLL